MLPFAAVLAIAAMGQTLVVQQGGIDLSVPGMISLTIVLLTSYPNGDVGEAGLGDRHRLRRHRWPRERSRG